MKTKTSVHLDTTAKQKIASISQSSGIALPGTVACALCCYAHRWVVPKSYFQ